MNVLNVNIMKLYKFLIVLFCANLAFAQNPKEIELWADNYNNKVKFLNNGKYENVIGSPFDSEEFMSVEVEGIGKVAEKLRYNAVTDQMEFEKENKIFNLDPLPNQIIYFNNGLGPNYKYIEYDFTDGAKKGYAYVLVDGVNYKLLKRSIKYLKNNSLNTQIKQRDTSFEIENKPAEYLLETGGKFYKFPKNKKTLAKSLGSKNNEMYNLLEKYNFNSEKDLIELVNELNK